MKRGAEEALAPRFDRVRKYVRTPQKGESWAFAQYCDLMGNFKQDVTIVLNSHDSSEFVGIAVGGAMAFGVDLLSSGDLSSWVEQEFPPGTLILGPDHRVPRAQRPPRDGAKHRVTIYLEA